MLNFANTGGSPTHNAAIKFIPQTLHDNPVYVNHNPMFFLDAEDRIMKRTSKYFREPPKYESVLVGASNALKCFVAVGSAPCYRINDVEYEPLRGPKSHCSHDSQCLDGYCVWSKQDSVGKSKDSLCIVPSSRPCGLLKNAYLSDFTDTGGVDLGGQVALDSDVEEEAALPLMMQASAAASDDNYDDEGEIIMSSEYHGFGRGGPRKKKNIFRTITSWFHTKDRASALSHGGGGPSSLKYAQL